MPARFRLASLTILAAVPATMLIMSTLTAAPDAHEPVDFGREVRPILADRCFVCHGPDASTRKAGVRLDTHEHATAARPRGGPAIVPGDHAASALWQRITAPDPADRMPPPDHQPLAAAEIATLTRWIDAGAAYDVHWSLRPLRPVAPPPVDGARGSGHPIDRFIVAGLREAGLEPAPPAAPEIALRRLHLDLTGLPPRPEDVARFVADPGADAWRAEVERLLASPAFGERWARHWLDLMRYAETYGHEFDYPIRHAWQYRDSVIRALNADVPYDAMVTEHIAGDLLPQPRRHPTEGFNESIIATGFWFLSQGTHGPVDVRQDEADRIDNQIDVLTKAFLATTVTCARCHDHKFDPIATRDYYALAGFLQSSRRQEAYLDPGGRIAGAVAEMRLARERVTRAMERVDGSVLRRRRPPLERILPAVREVVRGSPRPGEMPPDVDDVVFEDFESGTLDRWTRDGDAFDPTPIGPGDVGAYQGDVHARGRGLVNSHNVRVAADVRGADQLQGTLTSVPFVIERDAVHLLIGGGRHADRTCVQVLVDDAVVASVTGFDDNVMRPVAMDVRAWRGREARLRIVDHESGGWGHIAADHIVFSDRSPASIDDRRRADVVAAEFDVEPATLARWVDALRDLPPEHPLADWRAVALTDAPPPESGSGGDPFTTFAGDEIAAWFATGWAFVADAESFARSRADGVGPVDQASSGSLSPRLRGTLRSPTFEITSDFIEYRWRGSGGRVRVIVDGYVLDEFNALLFEGMTVDLKTDEPRVWRTHRQDVRRYRGHRAHIELIDDGDDWLAVDAIAFVNADATRAAPTPAPAFDTIAHLVDDAASALDRTLRAWPARSGDATSDALLDWIIDAELIDWPESVATVRAQAAARVANIESSLPAPMRVLAIADGTGEDESVFIRGNPRALGAVAARQVPPIMTTGTQAPITSGSGRLELAQRLVSDADPLPARVAVNRVWHHLFGRGLVESVDDFGLLGRSPTHPDLLDHLAWWFAHDAQWSTKALIRLIVTSDAYRMSSDLADEATEHADPENALLHRQRLWRLDGETLRDSILAVSGTLDPTMFGPSVPVHITPFMDGRGRPARSGPLDGDGRRSIYLEVRRNFLSPMMLAFDTPTPTTTVGRRNRSNVPAQSLMLLNDPFIHAEAARWADRMLETVADPSKRLDAMVRCAIGRPIREAEIEPMRAFLVDEAGERDWTDDPAAWTALAHVIFNLKEFALRR